MNENDPRSNDLPADRLWTADEAAAYLRISVKTLDRRIADSGLPFERLGGKRLFRKESIDAWLGERAEAA